MSYRAEKSLIKSFDYYLIDVDNLLYFAALLICNRQYVELYLFAKSLDGKGDIRLVGNLWI